jgi:hypothetical protein
LKKQGFVSNNGELVNQNNIKPQIAQNNQAQTGFTNGVYLFNTGILIAPQNKNVKPQQVRLI